MILGAKLLWRFDFGCKNGLFKGAQIICGETHTQLSYFIKVSFVLTDIAVANNGGGKAHQPSCLSTTPPLQFHIFAQQGMKTAERTAAVCWCSAFLKIVYGGRHVCEMRCGWGGQWQRDLHVTTPLGIA